MTSPVARRRRAPWAPVTRANRRGAPLPLARPLVRRALIPDAPLRCRSRHSTAAAPREGAQSRPQPPVAAQWPASREGAQSRPQPPVAAHWPAPREGAQSRPQPPVAAQDCLGPSLRATSTGDCRERQSCKLGDVCLPCAASQQWQAARRRRRAVRSHRSEAAAVTNPRRHQIGCGVAAARVRCRLHQRWRWAAARPVSAGARVWHTH